MPSRRATACAVVRLSPVSMTTRMPSSRSALSAAGVRRLDRIGDGDDAGDLAVDRHEDRGGAVLAQPLGLAPSSARSAMPSSARNLALPSTTRRPLDHADHALAGRRVEARDRRELEPALLRRRDDRGGQRMLARPLDAGGEAQHVRLVEARRPATTATTFGLPSVKRAGLVDHERVDLLHALERLGVLDQHAGLRAAADADHDRHRRGEPERAGAGDDQHADGGDQAIGEARLRPEHRPGGERQRARPRSRAGTNQPET